MHNSTIFLTTKLGKCVVKFLKIQYIVLYEEMRFKQTRGFPRVVV